MKCAMWAGSGAHARVVCKQARSLNAYATGQTLPQGQEGEASSHQDACDSMKCGGQCREGGGQKQERERASVKKRAVPKSGGSNEDPAAWRHVFGVRQRFLQVLGSGGESGGAERQRSRRECVNQMRGGCSSAACTAVAAEVGLILARPGACGCSRAALRRVRLAGSGRRQRRWRKRGVSCCAGRAARSARTGAAALLATVAVAAPLPPLRPG